MKVKSERVLRLNISAAPKFNSNDFEQREAARKAARAAARSCFDARRQRSAQPAAGHGRQ